MKKKKLLVSFVFQVKRPGPALSGHGTFSRLKGQRKYNSKLTLVLYLENSKKKLSFSWPRRWEKRMKWIIREESFPSANVARLPKYRVGWKWEAGLDAFQVTSNLFFFFNWSTVDFKGFPGGSVVKNLPANAGDTGFFPRSGRPPGEGNGSPF